MPIVAIVEIEQVFPVGLEFVAGGISDGLAAQAASQPDTASVASLSALWAGAVLAMGAADGLAVVAGSLLGAHVRRQTLAWVSGGLFAAFGLFTLARVAASFL